MTSEQRPPVNNGHFFWVPGVVVTHMFDCTFNVKIEQKKIRNILVWEYHPRFIFKVCLTPTFEFQRKWKRLNSFHTQKREKDAFTLKLPGELVPPIYITFALKLKGHFFNFACIFLPQKVIFQYSVLFSKHNSVFCCWQAETINNKKCFNNVKGF